MKLADMKEKDLLERVLRDYEDSKSHHKPLHDKFREYYRMYRAKHEYEEAIKNRSSLYIPYVYAIIETITPRAVKAVISNKPFLAVVPNEEYNSDKAKALEALLQYQLETKINFVRITTNFIKDMLIYGTGTMRTAWKHKTAFRKRREMFPYMDEETGELKVIPQEIEEEAVLYDAPEITNVDVLDFFVEPHATDIDTAGYVIHRLAMDKDTLLEYVRQDYYNKEVEVFFKNWEEENGIAGNRDFGTHLKAEDNNLGTGRGLPKFEVLEYWTNEHVVAVLEKEYIIKNESNPYYHNQKPFVTAVDIPVSNEFYGIGEVENLQDLQLELNTLRNQKLDNVTMTLNAMWKVIRAADVDPDNLRSRAGGIVYVDEMNDIEKLEFPNITANAYEEVATIQKDMDNTSGVYDYARGRTTDRRETATTANILTQSANERFDMKIIMLAEEGLKRLGLQLISLNQQYLDTDVTVRMSGQDPMSMHHMEVPLTAILGSVQDYDIIVTGTAVNTNLTKEARLDKLIQLYGIISNEPLVNKPAFIREVLRLTGARETESFLLPEAERIATSLTLSNLLGQQQGAPAPMGQAPIAGMPPMGGQDPMGGGIPDGGVF